MGYAMREIARVWVEASLWEQNRMATEIEIRKGVFLPFYSCEFDSLTCDKILTAIERAVQCGARESESNRAILWVENPRS